MTNNITRTKSTYTLYYVLLLELTGDYGHKKEPHENDKAKMKPASKLRDNISHDALIYITEWNPFWHIVTIHCTGSKNKIQPNQ